MQEWYTRGSVLHIRIDAHLRARNVLHRILYSCPARCARETPDIMGWVHNLDNSNVPSSAPHMIAVVSTFSILALLAVALRFYARYFTNRKPWIDDYTALVSVVCVFVLSSYCHAPRKLSIYLTRIIWRDTANCDNEQLLLITYAGLAIGRESPAV